MSLKKETSTDQALLSLQTLRILKFMLDDTISTF